MSKLKFKKSVIKSLNNILEILESLNNLNENSERITESDLEGSYFVMGDLHCEDSPAQIDKLKD